MIYLESADGRIVPLPSSTLDDGSISFTALGILQQLLVMPADRFPVTAENLAIQFTETADEICEAFQELGRAGYCRLSDDLAVLAASTTASSEWAEQAKGAGR